MYIRLRRCVKLFTLESNKRATYYAKFLGKTERRDASGFRTLDYSGEYGTPTKLMCNVADRTGNPQIDAFGIDTDYSVQIIADLPLVLAEGDIMWIKEKPASGKPADYVVIKSTTTLTHAIYALRERTKKWNTE